MPRAFFALLVLVAGLAGALWFVAGSERERPAVVPEASSAGDPVPDPASAAPLDSAAIVAGEPAPERPAEPALRREVVRDVPASVPARAQWVDGRVVLPPGTPDDERLFVMGGSWDDDAHLRTEVAPDGTFRLAFPEGRRSGRIVLEGRYLCSERVSWELDSLPVVIEPELGGRIEVRVRAPGATPLTGEVELRRAADRPAWMDPQLRGARVSELGLATFDALKPGDGYVVAYEGEGLVALSAGVDVVGGRTREVELELRRGVVLAGVVRDSNGAPVAGAQITLFAASSRVGQRVETQADGTFRFDALWPGRIELDAEREGFTFLRRSLGDLVAGTRREDLEIELSRGGAIAGRVLAPDGQPIAAQLELVRRTLADGQLQSGPTARGESADDGSFRITGLAPDGEYIVRASAEDPADGAQRRRDRDRWFAELENVAVGTENLRLELARGHELTGRVRGELGGPLSDFVITARRVDTYGDGQLARAFEDPDGSFAWTSFPPGDWNVVATAAGHARSDALRVSVPSRAPIELVLPREARVRGRVLAPDGSPCVRATVNAWRASGEPEFQHLDGTGQKTTDENGEFELVRLAPGVLVLSARSAAGAPSERLELALAAGDVITDVVLALRAGGTIRGEVVGSDGQPLPGLRVSVSTMVEPCVTDGDGRFAATNVPPGSIVVGTTTRDGFGLQQTVELDAGATEHVRLALPRTTSVRLHGTLTAGGEPIAGASVYAHRASDERDEGSEVSPPQARSDEDGRYELTLPGSGSYWLNIDPGSFDAGGLSWNVPLEVPETAEHDFDVAIPVGRISGRVRGISGEPLARVVVESEPVRHEGRDHGSARARTDEEGRYELLVPAGFHVVVAGNARRLAHGKAHDPRYVEGRSGELSIAAGAHLRGVDFVLRSGGSVAGRVRDSAGQAVYGAGVWTTVPEGWRVMVFTDGDGAFRIDGLEPGPRGVRATGAATVTRIARVVIVDGETAEVELVLEPGTLVHVRTHDPAGNALGCEMEVLDALGAPVMMRRMGQGEAQAGPLAPGRYRVLAQREQRRIERDLDIAAGQASLDVELVFE